MKVGLMLGGGGARLLSNRHFKALDEYGLKKCLQPLVVFLLGFKWIFLSFTNSYKTVFDAWMYGVDHNPIDFQTSKGKKIKRTF